eukprot:TRINITY_DN41878_c0_g1_i1.p1 TRINITY_DN41878_c0_g1~~TRINITY_DN41878_c0_g1_i1.p1  ORF type:complete len:267 (-),score=34.13 TRINITY_DN41878_c0_g1_i1:29-829(-)
MPTTRSPMQLALLSWVLLLKLRPLDAGISQDQVLQAQQQWGEALVGVGEAFHSGKHMKRAAAFVDELYAFKTEQGAILQLTGPDRPKQPFRLTREATVSFFVGGNLEFPDDRGFALQPWTAVKFENSGFVLKNDTAFAVGEYQFTDAQGLQSRAQYSFGYQLESTGQLRIVLQQSSVSALPGRAGPVKRILLILLKAMLVIAACFFIASLLAMTQVQARVSPLARWILAVRLLERTVQRSLRLVTRDASTHSTLPLPGSSGSGKVV